MANGRVITPRLSVSWCRAALASLANLFSSELDRWNAVSSRQTCKFLSNMAFAVTSMDEKKVQPISPVVTDYPASTEVQCSMYDTPQCPLSARIPPRPPAPVDAQLSIPVSCTGVPGSKQYDESDHVALHPQEPRCVSVHAASA